MTRQQISNTADTDRWRLPDRLTVDGAAVAAGVSGDGPPVVLVHGTPSSSYLWRAVIPRLAEQNTVYVWDLPGYGDSPSVPGEPVAIRTHARVLARLVEQWGLDRPVLVGHDIGAATVLRAHLVEGVPVRRIALLDAAVLSPWVTPVARTCNATSTCTARCRRTSFSGSPRHTSTPRRVVGCRRPSRRLTSVLSRARAGSSVTSTRFNTSTNATPPTSSRNSAP